MKGTKPTLVMVVKLTWQNWPIVLMVLYLCQASHISRRGKRALVAMAVVSNPRITMKKKAQLLA